MRYRYWIAFGASILLALVFITAGVGKLMGQSAFLLTLSTWLISENIAAWVAGFIMHNGWMIANGLGYKPPAPEARVPVTLT